MAKKKPIEQYDHKDKTRINNPPVGLVTPETDKDTGKKTYSYDPHLDPQLQWAGKTEHTSFEVPTVSLHVHERIEPRTIIEAVRKRNGDGAQQASFFDMIDVNPPLREAIEFYQHPHHWSNRFIAGDSLIVMNSLLEKEGMAGHVQMIYIDPPYGIKYGSNFQPFVNKREVRDGKDEDLTAEPEMLKAFRDTWELGIHSYLAYLRDRVLLARELLAESGSIFVQIGDENVHLVRNVLDEIFGVENFISLITVVKTSSATAMLLPNVSDYVLLYSKQKEQFKYRQLYLDKIAGGQGGSAYDKVVFPDGTRMSKKVAEAEGKDISNARYYRLSDLRSQRPPGSFPVMFEGREYVPTKGYWKTGEEGFNRLIQEKRIEASANTLNYIRYLDDFPAFPITNSWSDLGSSVGSEKIYVVQTNEKIIQRCLLMTTDPGDLVLDITCGSGTTAYVAEQWGRRWITCDTSRVSITLAKQRLMTALFDYYELAHPDEGIGSGFKYKTVPHITLKSIANNEPPAQEDLCDQPLKDSSKARVSGPFTVEAVPSPAVKPLDELDVVGAADESVARSGESLRQNEWRDELLKSGIRGKGGQHIQFVRLEPLPATRWLHADAETKEANPQRTVVSFGPEHAPMEQKQVALALEEAQNLIPKPKIVVFTSFQFDPEAAKDIDETNWPGVTLLKAQMNADLFTDDLKKKRVSNESFWLIGQPDVRVEKTEEGKYQVEVLGFDYYNTKTGSIDSGSSSNIAMWSLDTDYDGRSLLPQQVFFPMAGEKDGWARLAKNLKAEIDEDLIEAYRGTVSLPFELDDNRRIAVKIVDDRGIESLKIVEVG